MTSKSDFLTSILTYFRQKSDRGVPCRTPPFHPVLLHIQTTRALEKSRGPCSAVRCSASKKFQSVSGRGPPRVRGGGGFSVGSALSPLLNRSGEFPKTGGLYSAVTHRTCYPLRRPGSFNLDLIGLLLLVRK